MSDMAAEIRNAYRDGYTMTYIASVLGISVQKATALRDSEREGQAK
jgi:ribosomal protein L10